MDVEVRRGNESGEEGIGGGLDSALTVGVGAVSRTERDDEHLIIDGT